MSDRIVVMNDGVIEQLGSAEEIYGRPASRFVAGFVRGRIRDPAGLAPAGQHRTDTLRRAHPHVHDCAPVPSPVG